MTDSQERTAGPIEVPLALLGWNKSIWVKDAQLPFPPFPGAGIRIDVYVMLNVESVVIGDLGYDVTCICTFERGAEHYTADRVRSFGFAESEYP